MEILINFSNPLKIIMKKNRLFLKKDSKAFIIFVLVIKTLRLVLAKSKNCSFGSKTWMAPK